ncbi:O-sialoglycoprotein endopeptidase [Babesia microti strain RI]|uniref:N(6)-L-threonylcarbamoyladenine synthase n=1 Tax=Babesia microti (strain RI) TaxID=1133968 RepID=A0A1N6LY45_BABMR|nr:O-sialoglycoprotein endopeptidase [Babesia microti strain RI]SIO73798.1 O-sialoglycoprotein endopeptidase [Babesia microti strain RI]|eukprot:XP_021337857.1 O-sialoglycoprotein endopeptidase [Babesia microti strain RI]
MCPKYTIGIECSANKLAIGILDSKCRILSNVRRTFAAPAGEGFFPRCVARHHRQHIAQLIKLALNESCITLSQIGLICYTKGPGFGSCLYVGSVAAKVLHLLTSAPVVCVNHCVAHVEMGRFISQFSDPAVLYVSGGNTQVLVFDRNRRVYSVIGETLDIAAGNVIDRVARLLKLPNYPAPGLSIELLAQKATIKHKLLPLPIALKGMDCALNGIVSKLELLISRHPNMAIKRFETVQNEALKPLCDGNYTFVQDAKSRDFQDTCSVGTRSLTNDLEYVKLETQKDVDLNEFHAEDVCYSVQEILFAMLVEITERAMSFTNADSVLLVGGVGCNRRLQEMIGKMAECRGAKLCPMDERYCIDNGIMIGYTGLLEYQVTKKSAKLEEMTVSQRYRTDETIIHWR